jgi:DNA polymerase III subunit epsilon
MYLIFDTETTGLPAWNDPSDAPHQPHIVDIACSLFDRTGMEIERYDAIINPGCEIPEGVARIHGITTSIAQAEGVEPIEAFDNFCAMAGKADVISAYNASFDLLMVRILGARVTGSKWEMQTGKFDIAGAATIRCELPPTERMIRAGYGNQFKKPTLGEAYETLFGEALENSHRARPDCDAAARLFFHLREREPV